MAASPAAAVHKSRKCSVDKSLQPLMEFLHEVIVFAKLGGLLVGFLGIVTGALLIAAPLGPEWKTRGKNIIKSSILGLLILVSSGMIVGFITSNLPVC